MATVLRLEPCHGPVPSRFAEQNQRELDDTNADDTAAAQSPSQSPAGLAAVRHLRLSAAALTPHCSGAEDCRVQTAAAAVAAATAAAAQVSQAAGPAPQSEEPQRQATSPPGGITSTRQARSHLLGAFGAGVSVSKHGASADVCGTRDAPLKAAAAPDAPQHARGPSGTQSPLPRGSVAGEPDICTQIKNWSLAAAGGQPSTAACDAQPPAPWSAAASKPLPPPAQPPAWQLAPPPSTRPARALEELHRAAVADPIAARNLLTPKTLEAVLSGTPTRGTNTSCMNTAC